MSTPHRQRTFIAKHTTLTARLRIYALPDALEIEERVYSLQRRRVLFDEVQMMALHRRRRWPLITACFLVTASFAALVAAFFPAGETTGTWISGGLGLLFLLVGALHTALPAHILTVTSRRNQEEIHFGLRERRARQWFGQLQQSVREAQHTVTEEVARQNDATRRLASMGGSLPMPPSTLPASTTPTIPTPSPAPSMPAAAVPNTPAAPQPPHVQEAPATSPSTTESAASIPPPPDFMPPRG